MQVDQKIFRAYDIRGIAMGEGAPLTPDVAEAIGKGSGTYLLRKGHQNMVVGRDGRLTSEELTERFIKGVLSTGLNVTSIGLAVSPMLYFATCQPEFDCGVNVTASHNPKDYNGFKIVGDGAHSICGEELQNIYKLIEAEDFEEGDGQYAEIDVWPRYREALISQVSLARPLKIVVDAANGVAGAFVEDLIANLPNAEADFLYTEVDGNFPNHEANPEKEANMLEVIDLVKSCNADLGFGFDGDGDRVGLVDENGKFYSADLLLLVMARDLLETSSGAKVVFDIKCSRVLENDIAEKGGVPLRSATGHSFIETRMREEGALLGGEISGHMFFAGSWFGFDDAFLAMLKLMEIASNVEKGFSSLFADVPQVVNTPEIKMPCSDETKFQIVKEVTEKFVSEGYDCLTVDGVFVSLDENTWGAVRCSNTSPNLTLRFEALDLERLEEIMSLFRGVLAEYEELDISAINLM